MAMKIIASRNEGMKDGKNYLRAELIADSASELSVEGMSNYHFTFGSIAYAIAEKSFYVLNSSGTWVSFSGKADEQECVDIRARLDALEYNDIKINSFTASPALSEMGTSQTITLSWQLNKSATNQSIDGSPVTGNSIQYRNVTSGRTYTLNVTDGKTTASKSVAVNFANQIYFGAASDLTTVTELTKVLSDNVERTITVDAINSKYIIYAIPARLGNVVFFVSGFEGGFEAPVEQALSNASGFVELYKIYRSTRANLGVTTVEVKEG